jgi:hypothetical protein
MSARLISRFDSIEEAQEYIRLLREVVTETRESVRHDMAEPAGGDSRRRRDALMLVDYKLEQLHQHLATSSRLLNDLRTLRRALYGERQTEQLFLRSDQPR